MIDRHKQYKEKIVDARDELKFIMNTFTGTKISNTAWTYHDWINNNIMNANRAVMLLNYTEVDYCLEFAKTNLIYLKRHLYNEI